MGTITQKMLPFMGRKKKPEQRPVGLTSKRDARIDVINLLGGKCAKCGFDDPRALQIDHVDGGGARERRKTQNQKLYILIFDEVKSGSKKYQVLCANCNWIKRFENGESGYYYTKPKFSG